MNDTTRRFPRTLNEAFPHDARHAYAIQRVSRTDTVLGWLLAGAMGVGLGLALVAWWSA